MIRLGLCCKFHEEPIRFRVTTATAMLRLPRSEALERVAQLCRTNADALMEALQYCHDHDIGDFRINSQVLPLKTHPEAGYDMSELPDHRSIIARFKECGAYARQNRLRTTLHPDQFILLSSPDDGVTERSIEELCYQAEVAEWVGADVINIHGGGGYGDKEAALGRVAKRLRKLPKAVRRRLTLENDERVYSPSELLPLCRAEGVPFVYDAHHHRCLSDGLTVESVTEQAAATWNREPLFHVSSPKEGWDGPKPSRHHDYIDPRDFPPCWLGLDLTVEVEAKAKEVAIGRLQKWIARQDTH